MRLASRAALLAIALGLPSLAAAQSADNVLVVINDASPASVQIGEYYVRKRAIAQDHVVHLKDRDDRRHLESRLRADH